MLYIVYYITKMGASFSCDDEYYKVVEELKTLHGACFWFLLITIFVGLCSMIHILNLEKKIYILQNPTKHILKQDKQALNRQAPALLNISEELEELLICPITLEVMYNPWIDTEGNTYEYAAIIDHLSRTQTSPITRNPMYPTDLYLRPNRPIRDIIQLYTKPAKLPSALTRN